MWCRFAKLELLKMNTRICLTIWPDICVASPFICYLGGICINVRPLYDTIRFNGKVIIGKNKNYVCVPIFWLSTSGQTCRISERWRLLLQVVICLWIIGFILIMFITKLEDTKIYDINVYIYRIQTHESRQIMNIIVNNVTTLLYLKWHYEAHLISNIPN